MLADRVARRSGAIVRRAVRSTIAIAPLVDRRAVHVRRACSSIAPLDRRSHRSIDDRAARSTIAPLVGAVRSSDERRDLGSLLSLSLSDLGSLFSLSLSLFFRKLFEVKMRGENDFRVKGENIGQPEVIFCDSQTLRFYGK